MLAVYVKLLHQPSVELHSDMKNVQNVRFEVPAAVKVSSVVWVVTGGCWKLPARLKVFCCGRVGQRRVVFCVVSRCCDPVALTRNYSYLLVHLGKRHVTQALPFNTRAREQQVTAVKQTHIGF